MFGADRVYTPQAVVDGRDELVGSDQACSPARHRRAVHRPHARVEPREPRRRVSDRGGGGHRHSAGRRERAAAGRRSSVTEDGLTTDRQARRERRPNAASRRGGPPDRRARRVVARRASCWHVRPGSWQRDRLNAVVSRSGREIAPHLGRGRAPAVRTLVDRPRTPAST